MRKITFLAIAMFISLACQLSAQAVSSLVTAQSSPKSSSSGLDAIVSLELRNVPIETALHEIARRTTPVLRVVFGDEVEFNRQLVSVNVQHVPASRAIAAVLKGSGIVYRVTETGQVLFVQAMSSYKSSTQGVVIGTVTDAKTGRGISGANISAGNGLRGVVSGEDGTYKLSGLPAGTHTISVRLVGYAKQTRPVTIGDGVQATLNFALEPSASMLSEVVVTGTVIATELKAVPSAITIVTAKQIEERGITRIDQLFRGDIPGLFAMNLGSSSPLDSVMMFSRGATRLQNINQMTEAATDPIKTYLDGVELVNPNYLSQIDPASIERIEILTGPQASTVYGSNAINGVMQIFTKRGLTARPQLTTNIISGVAQNNFNSHLAPNHLTDARVSGTEGRLSYNTGGSWNYVGAWTPAKRTQRSSWYGGSRMQYGHLAIDASARTGMTSNKQTGSASQVNYEMISMGNWMSPSNYAFEQLRSTLIGRTLGLTLGYAPVSWWSQEIVLGTDVSNNESLWMKPRYMSHVDTTVSIQQTNSARLSQRYSTTAQISPASGMQITLVAGLDRWRMASSSMSVTTGSLTGTLSGAPNPPRVQRNKPGKNMGGFAQGQIGIAEKLFLTYGVRAEWNPNYGEEAQPNLAPRYGVAYTRDIGKLVAKLRASYGRSTRPPTNDQRRSTSETTSLFTDVYGPFDRQLSNADLGPEFQQGGEGGLELYFANRGSLVFNRFNQTVDDLIASVSGVDSVRSLQQYTIQPTTAGVCSTFNDGYCYRRQSQNLNIGSIRNQGWEVQGSMNTGPFVTRGTYSWIKGRMIGITQKFRQKFNSSTYAAYQPGAPFEYLSEHTWAAGITYSRGASTIGVNMNGTGFVYRRGGDISMYTSGLVRFKERSPIFNFPSAYRQMAAGYTMADLNAAHRFSRNVEATLQVWNLTDYYQNDALGTYAAIGRQTKAGLRIRL